MRTLLPPPIDSRSAAAVAAELETQLGKYLTGWKPGKPGDPPDPGKALVRIFSHFAGIIIDRLNRTPDKAFLAFLNLIGASQLPPQPARAPLTFHLAEGATTDIRVPAGSRVAATAGKEEADPPVFETTSDLFLTGAALTGAYVRDPARDAWSNLSALIGSAAPVTRGSFAFRGNQAIERRLWISHRLFAGPGPRDVAVAITAQPDDAKFPELEWGWWDGTTWQVLPKPSIKREPSKGGMRLTVEGLPPVPETLARPANGGASAFSGTWIGARLARDLDKDFVLPPQEIISIQVGTGTARKNLVPDAAFSGPTAIDPSKDFLPFGERPKLGDVFLLACNEAFGEAGPTDDPGRRVITLTVTASDLEGGRLSPRDPNAKDDGVVTLTWEYWNGSDWRAIGQSNQGAPSVDKVAAEDFKFSDATRAFMKMERAKDAEITFRRPKDWKPSAVAGKVNYWIRTRIASGGYGHDAGYLLRTDNTGKVVEGYVLDPATWHPPSLQRISIAYTSPMTAPDRVLVEGSFVLTDQTQAVATRSKKISTSLASADNETTPAVYLAFRRPGATVAFANQPVSLYVGVDETYETPEAVESRRRENARRLAANNGGNQPAPRPPEVVWEYRNAVGWRPLGALDETAGFTRRGLITFIGPPGIIATSEFGQTAFWLRARSIGGEHVVPPRVNRFVTNAIWAHHATSINNEVVGSGTAEPGQVFYTSTTPVLTGQYVEVKEPERPTEAERAVLEAEERTACVNVVTSGDGDVEDIWVRWHEVPDLYLSGPDRRHYLIDRLTGAITFGGDSRGRAPQRGLNNIRITYRSGGGIIGNRPAGTITQMKSAIPFVDSVTNPEAAAGGAEAQSLEEVRRHAPAMLRHQNRAVAIADYEDLAFMASPAVARAKGIPARNAEGAGNVTLVVVPLSTENQPVPSLELLYQVKDHVSSFAPPTVNLIVRGPDWLEISVSVEIVPVSFERAMELRSAVNDRLLAFLNPLTGALEREGWQFGRRPHRSDFHGLIEAIPDVDHIRDLTITLEPDLPPGEATMVYAGKFKIVLVASSENNA